MKDKKSLLFFGMLLMGMLAAATAQAQTANYPGSNCVVYSGTGAVYNYSTLGNNSSGTLYVDCPAVNQTPTGIENGWVKVLDQNTGENVCCTLLSIYASGSSLMGWWSNPVCSTGYGSNWQTINFSAVGNSTSAHVYYSCQIPRVGVSSSWIGTYNVNE